MVVSRAEMVSSSSPVRVVIADDHDCVHLALRRVLPSEVGVEIVAEPRTSESTLRVVQGLEPQVVVLDLGLPTQGGIWVLNELRRGESTAKVVVFTGSESRDEQERARLAGANSVCWKGGPITELVDAVRKAAGVPDGVRRSRVGGEPLEFGALSRMQRRVVDLVVQGYTSKQIAEALGVRPKSVETHRERALIRLGLNSWRDLLRQNRP